MKAQRHNPTKSPFVNGTWLLVKQEIPSPAHVNSTLPRLFITTLKPTMSISLTDLIPVDGLDAKALTRTSSNALN